MRVLLQPDVKVSLKSAAIVFGEKLHEFYDGEKGKKKKKERNQELLLEIKKTNKQQNNKKDICIRGLNFLI